MVTVPGDVAAPAEEAPAGSRFVSLRPLRHRNFALVWTAALVSNVGTWMETVAVGALVAETTGRAGWTGLVAAAGFLPMGLLGPIGGAIADRVDRRRFVFVSTVLQMAVATSLTVLSATGNATPGAIAVTVFFAGCIAGIGFPAYSAMLPDLVGKDDLLGAISLSTAQFNLGRVVGPALAGIVIAVGSYTWAFALNVVSFGAMLVALAFLRLPHREPDRSEAGLWERIRIGARGLRDEPGCRSAVMLISIVALTASPFIALIPAMAEVRFEGGAKATSLFVTMQGVGAVAGALALPVLAQRFGRRQVLMASLLVLPVTLVLYAAAPNIGLTAAALVLVGAGYIAVFSGLNTVVQLRAPTHLRARILSLHFLALGALYPVGSAIQGRIADDAGIKAVTASGAVILLAAFLLVAWLRPQRLQALDDPASP